MTTGQASITMQHNQCQLCGINCPEELQNSINPNKFPLKCKKCNKEYGGVCYVVHSECKNNNQSQNLPHIVYQPNHLKQDFKEGMIDWFFGDFILNKKIVATLLPHVSNDPNIFINYLLHPSLRCKILENYHNLIPKSTSGFVHLLNGFNDIPQLFYEQYALILHFQYDEQSNYLIKELNTQNEGGRLEYLLAQSDIQIVLQLRTGTNKRLGNSIHGRLDIFLQYQLWEKLSPAQRNQIKAFQLLVEEQIKILFSQINKQMKPSEKVNTSPNGNHQNYKLTNLPLLLVSMRDIFKIHLLPVRSTMTLDCSGRKKITKTTYYFPAHNVPKEYDFSLHNKFRSHFDYNAPVGVTTYEGFFTEDELTEIENSIDETDKLSKNGYYNKINRPFTCQKTLRGERIVRSKFFFNARYLWTKEQMDASNSSYANGIRVDVAEPPEWMIDKVSKPMVEAGIIPTNFLNEFALNIYHDGSEGLGQHFDDKQRFQRPIFSLRLFSDCRLSFDSKDFSMCNSLFFVPMPRGCITVLERNSFAADSVKHCIRSRDMIGKSAAIILRQIHPELIREARLLHRTQWFTNWLSGIPGLDQFEIPQYVNNLVLEELDDKTILFVTECDLKQIGFMKMGPRKLIYNNIEKLRSLNELNSLARSSCNSCPHSSALMMSNGDSGTQSHSHANVNTLPSNILVNTTPPHSNGTHHKKFATPIHSNPPHPHMNANPVSVLNPASEELDEVLQCGSINFILQQPKPLFPVTSVDLSKISPVQTLKAAENSISPIFQEYTSPTHLGKRLNSDRLPVPLNITPPFKRSPPTADKPSL